MSINYAGLHLIGENYVTRPLSQQTYTNKMADVIHGAEAYIPPRKVDNTYISMFEDLCKSPQIKHIRTVMFNSRARFGESGEDADGGPPEAESPPKDIPPTKGQLKSSIKQQAKDAASESKKGSKSAVRFEVEEAIKEAKRLSSAKKAKQAATPSTQGSRSSFVSARSSFSETISAKKAARQAATPRDLDAAFEGAAPTPKAKASTPPAPKSAPAPVAKAAEVKAAPAAEVKEASARVAKINAFVTQTDGANGVVTIIQATGRGAKGFRPAYVGHDGVAYGYLDSEVTVVQLRKMIESFEKIKAKVPDADKASKKDIGNYISRIKEEIKKRG